VRSVPGDPTQVKGRLEWASGLAQAELERATRHHTQSKQYSPCRWGPPATADSLEESIQITCAVDNTEYYDHATIKPVEKKMLGEAAYGSAS
jgi:hypothetical protein